MALFRLVQYATAARPMRRHPLHVDPGHQPDGDDVQNADVVLPSTTQLEHFDVQGAWGHHYISANLPAIPPLGQAKSHGEIMRLLAARLALADPAFRETDEQIRGGAADGLTLEELKARGFIKRLPPRPLF